MCPQGKPGNQIPCKGWGLKNAPSRQNDCKIKGYGKKWLPKKKDREKERGEREMGSKKQNNEGTKIFLS